MEHWDPMKGCERAQVKWFNPDKGFGFLLIPGQADLFLHIGDRMIHRYEPHMSGDPHCVGTGKPSKGEYRDPKREGGEWVRFGRWQSRDGKPKAIEWDFVEEYDKAKASSEALVVSQKLSRASSRNVAGLFDLPIPGPSNERGHGDRGDICSTSISWSDYFKDSVTGEIYQVRCWDGESGGRGAYSRADEHYRSKCYKALFDRFQAAAKNGEPGVRISRNERILMASWHHRELLETAEGLRDGKNSEDGLEGGLVGHFHGVPVICDLGLPDNLPAYNLECLPR